MEKDSDHACAVGRHHLSRGARIAVCLRHRHTSDRLKTVIKFLLFREDTPKHAVIGPADTVTLFFASLGLILAVSVSLIFWSYYLFGVAGFLGAYIIAAVLPLEILHCLYDR